MCLMPDKAQVIELHYYVSDSLFVWKFCWVSHLPSKADFADRMWRSDKCLRSERRDVVVILVERVKIRLIDWLDFLVPTCLG